MRNNKEIKKEDVKVGTRVKVRFPSGYASDGRNMEWSWFKAKIIDVSERGLVTLMVYPAWCMGRYFCTSLNKIVKCL